MLDPNAHAPDRYPRRILLMVTGRTPQVVTETLYALAVTPAPGQQRFIPTEVRVITTAEGAKDARLELLSAQPGWFHALCRDYDLPAMAFTEEHIEELRDADGLALPDIRTRADNDRAADRIVRAVQEYSTDPTAALHVSLAGGRKTMGYYLGYALSLFGRPQDRLSHVLVSQPFESNHDFYYPTPHSRIIHTYSAIPQQRRPIDTKDAEVTLAEIPFVRLREHLPRHLTRLSTGEVSFSEVVAAAQQALAPPRVCIDYPARCLRIGNGQEVRLAPVDLAFYGWIARRMVNDDGAVGIPTEGAPATEYLPGYLQEYQRAGNHASTLGRLQKDRGLSKTFFEQRKAAIKRALEEELGSLASRYDLVPLVPGRPIQWGLEIDPDAIEFTEE